MTYIKYTDNKSSLSVHIKGHALFKGAKGDIVCASISTLTNVLCVALDELPEEDYRVRIREGKNVDVLISVRRVNEGTRKVFDTVFEVLEDLASQYPNNVSLCKSALVEKC